MTTSKAHFILALMMIILFVKEWKEDCMNKDSGRLAAAVPAAALLFLINDWESTLDKRSLCSNPFAWVFKAVVLCAARYISFNIYILVYNFRSGHMQVVLQFLQPWFLFLIFSALYSWSSSLPRSYF